MQSLLAEVEPGKTYLTLDCSFIPMDVLGVSFDGWFAPHDLDFLPQTAALEDGTVVDEILANKRYWLENRLPDDEAR
jgi:hypothetical protein